MILLYINFIIFVTFLFELLDIFIDFYLKRLYIIYIVKRKDDKDEFSNVNQRSI